MNYHIEKIVCPQCRYVQEAKVEYTPIWNIYIHHCDFCSFIIMESDWQKAPFLAEVGKPLPLTDEDLFEQEGV